jgi:hypothetical protein
MREGPDENTSHNSFEIPKDATFESQGTPMQ